MMGVDVMTAKSMVKAEQISCFALSKSIHNILCLPQNTAIGNAALDGINTVRGSEVCAESSGARGIVVRVIRSSQGYVADKHVAGR